MHSYVPDNNYECNNCGRWWNSSRTAVGEPRECNDCKTLVWPNTRNNSLRNPLYYQKTSIMNNMPFLNSTQVGSLTTSFNRQAAANLNLAQLTLSAIGVEDESTIDVFNTTFVAPA